MMRSKRGESVVLNIQAPLAVAPVMRLGDFDGEFDMGAASDTFARLAKVGRYESGLALTLRSLIDRTRDGIDVGANVGSYSVLMESLLDEGRVVVACEPSDAAFSLLVRECIQELS